MHLLLPTKRFMNSVYVSLSASKKLRKKTTGKKCGQNMSTYIIVPRKKEAAMVHEIYVTMFNFDQNKRNTN